MKIILTLALLLIPLTTVAANKPPTISGSPSSVTTVGTAYSFTPAAKDPEGKKLSFVIRNRPSWLSFSYSTGRIAGTPSAGNVGLYSKITIYVKDGTNTVALKPFSIAVLQPVAGAATLSWKPPTTNTDGSALTNLAGYRIYYGTSTDAMNQAVDIKASSVITYMVDGLSPGTWYFAVTAYTSTGTESARSNIASKTVS
jgi:hypothetical protein